MLLQAGGFPRVQFRRRLRDRSALINLKLRLEMTWNYLVEGKFSRAVAVNFKEISSHIPRGRIMNFSTIGHYAAQIPMLSRQCCCHAKTLCPQSRSIALPYSNGAPRESARQSDLC